MLHIRMHQHSNDDAKKCFSFSRFFPSKYIKSEHFFHGPTDAYTLRKRDEEKKCDFFSPFLSTSMYIACRFFMLFAQLSWGSERNTRKRKREKEHKKRNSIVYVQWCWDRRMKSVHHFLFYSFHSNIWVCVSSITAARSNSKECCTRTHTHTLLYRDLVDFFFIIWGDWMDTRRTQ